VLRRGDILNAARPLALKISRAYAARVNRLAHRMIVANMVRIVNTLGCCDVELESKKDINFWK
jgi:hypothetical protein